MSKQVTKKKEVLSAAEKYKRASDKRRANNRIIKTKTKTAIKKVLSAITDKATPTEVVELFRLAQSRIDRTLTKGVYKKNKVARMKSSLSAKAKDYCLSVQA